MGVLKRASLAKIIGVIFMFLGVIAFLYMVLSFDYDYYNEIKHTKVSDNIERIVMEEQLIIHWVVGLTSLISSVAVGTVLLTLDKIAGLIEDVRDRLSAID